MQDKGKVRWQKLANKLKLYREKAGLTQQELAKKANVSISTILTLETQENVSVTYDIMKRLAKGLGVKVKNIFFDK